MSRNQRDKGNRRERELARLLGGVRVPLSGACVGFKGDVKALGLTWQCKARANGFKSLYSDLDGHDALAPKADRREWLVVLPASRLLALVEASA
jgi:hypothetical protein